METRTITFAEIEDDICTWVPHSSCMAVILYNDVAPTRATLNLSGALRDWWHFSRTFPDRVYTVWERVEGDTFRRIPDPLALLTPDLPATSGGAPIPSKSRE